MMTDPGSRGAAPESVTDSVAEAITPTVMSQYKGQKNEKVCDGTHDRDTRKSTVAQSVSRMNHDDNRRIAMEETGAGDRISLSKRKSDGEESDSNHYEKRRDNGKNSTKMQLPKKAKKSAVGVAQLPAAAQPILPLCQQDDCPINLDNKSYSDLKQDEKDTYLLRAPWKPMGRKVTLGRRSRRRGI